MKATSAFLALLFVICVFGGGVQARPANFEEATSQGASRRLLKAIDLPWGVPASFNASAVTIVDRNTSRYRDVAAVVGDTVTIHWNSSSGGNYSLWQIPSHTCPENFTTGAPGTAQIVSPHSAATVTLKMTSAGVVVFTSSGPGHCEAGVLVNIVVSSDGAPRSQGTTCKLAALDILVTHAGDVIPTAIYIAQNVTAPGPAAAPSASEDAT